MTDAADKPRLKQIRYDLRKKISTIMAGVLVVNALALLAFVTWLSADLETEHIRRYGRESVQMLEGFIKTRTGSIYRTSSGTRDSVQKYLNELRDAVPYFRCLILYDDNGKVLLQSVRPGEVASPLSLEQLKAGGGRTAYVSRVQTRGRGATIPKEWIYIHAVYKKPAIDWEHSILYSVLVILALTLLSLIVTYRWAQKMARPLREVIQVADEVAQGQAFREVKAKSSDEAGVIASLFNDINKRLQDRINDMAMMQLWSMDIGAELDREALYNLIVTTFANATGARRVALLLREKGRATLAVAAGLHVVNARLTPAGDEGLAGAVVGTENFVMTRDIAQHPEAHLFAADPATLPADSCYLALPIIAQMKVIGVLILGDRAVDRDRDFDPESVILFQTLATAAGSALENARLYELAITDELTRVYIRRFYNQRMFEEIERAANEQTPLSLIMLDIDHFKKFNDTYGHQTGDRVLIALAHVLRETVRGIDVKEAERRRDIVARYGGEEFSVILPNTGVQGALAVAERLRHNVETFTGMRSDEGQQLSITISLGVAEWQPGQSADHLLHCADDALYEAKHRGRNRAIAWPFTAEQPPAGA